MAELTRCRAADEGQLGTWLAAGSPEPRPMRSRGLINAEIALAVIEPDCKAAFVAMPAARAVQSQALARLAAAQRELDGAIITVAAEAATDYARTVLLPACDAMLAAEAKLVSLSDALLTAGNAPGAPTQALQAAADVPGPDYRKPSSGGRRAGF